MNRKQIEEEFYIRFPFAREKVSSQVISFAEHIAAIGRKEALEEASAIASLEDSGECAAILIRELKDKV